MDKMTIFGLPNMLVIACHVHYAKHCCCIIDICMKGQVLIAAFSFLSNFLLVAEIEFTKLASYRDKLLTFG